MARQAKDVAFIYNFLWSYDLRCVLTIFNLLSYVNLKYFENDTKKM